MLEQQTGCKICTALKCIAFIQSLQNLLSKNLFTRFADSITLWEKNDPTVSPYDKICINTSLRQLRPILTLRYNGTDISVQYTKKKKKKSNISCNHTSTMAKPWEQVLLYWQKIQLAGMISSDKGPGILAREFTKDMCIQTSTWHA